MSTRSRSLKERLVLFLGIYLVFAILLTGEEGGPLSRFLSNTHGGDGSREEDINQKLEFVHITETGGQVIEKAAASVGLNWGVCHFLSMADSIGCADPDYKWERAEGSYILTSRWHTPPKDLLAAGIDDNENNPYMGKDLFTVVRNPYTRMVAEYYNPYVGGANIGGDDDVEIMNRWISRHLSDLIQQRADYKARVAKGEELLDINSPDPLGGKHFNPQVDYVYDDEGKRLIDNVIHYEDLKSEFKALMREYGFSSLVQIPRGYRNEERQLTFMDLYPETIAIINQIAHEDFYAFGYEMVKDFSSEVVYNLRATWMPCSKIEPGNPSECEREIKKTKTPTDEEKEKYTAVTPIGLPHATTFMLGIFTDLSDQEVEARQRIRNTYLKESDEVRICSLQQYISQHETSRGLWVPCRIPYVFIVAGDPQRPDEHLDNFPLSIDRALISDAPIEEDDIVYLNISENDTHSGKARAYFKWAAKIGETFHIDFIGKASSSTLLDTTKLLNFLDMELPPAPLNRRMYGGSTWGSKTTYYATKPFYFMSLDLANFVGQRKVRWDWVEAIDIGKIVFSHPKPIKYVNCNPKLFWFEGLDTHEKWYNKWNNHMIELPRSKPFIQTLDVCNKLKEDGQI